MIRRLQRLLRPALAAVILLSGLVSLQQPNSLSAQKDGRYFDDTGFRVDSDPFWELYESIGKDKGIGKPISRTFRLLDRPTQLFQRGMMQLAPEGHAYIVGMLQDELLFPYASINGSIFPTYDINVVSRAPQAGSEEYDLKIIQFIKDTVPNEIDGQDVKFLENYLNPISDSDPNIRILLNLPVWGIPTSAPTRDPANQRIIYQRFERGLMVYDSGCRCTRILPVGELFKAVLTGQYLPADFESQKPNSPFLRQYDTDANLGPFRKDQLPDTDLTNAFLPSAQEPVSWATVEEVIPPGPDPFTYIVAPTSTPIYTPIPEPTSTSRSARATSTRPPATATPTRNTGAFTRDPSTVALQASDIGKEATVVLSNSGSDSRGKFYEIRFERDRDPGTLGLGPSVWYQKIWVANSSDAARSIFREESTNTAFPESADPHNGHFFMELPRLVDEQQQMASCEEEGCSAAEYFIHLRTVMRNANVVSLLYTYGDHQYAGGPDVLPNIRKIADRMRA